MTQSPVQDVQLEVTWRYSRRYGVALGLGRSTISTRLVPGWDLSTWPWLHGLHIATTMTRPGGRDPATLSGLVNTVVILGAHPLCKLPVGRPMQLRSEAKLSLCGKLETEPDGFPTISEIGLA